MTIATPRTMRPLFFVSLAAAAYPRIRNLEAELPDAVIEPNLQS